MKRESVLQVIKFTLFSASAGIIQTLVFALLHELADMRYWPAYLISLVLSVLWNFTLNRKYTFKSAANIPIAMAKTFGFYLVFTPLSTWFGHLADQAGINAYLIFAVTLLTNFVTEFLFTKFVVYRGQENTAK